MELAAQLDARSLRLDAAWVPREFNQEADDLSNGVLDGFDPRRRVGGESFEQVPFLVLNEFMKQGLAFYSQAK